MARVKDTLAGFATACGALRRRLQNLMWAGSIWGLLDVNGLGHAGVASGRGFHAD